MAGTAESVGIDAAMLDRMIQQASMQGAQARLRMAKAQDELDQSRADLNAAEGALQAVQTLRKEIDRRAEVARAARAEAGKPAAKSDTPIGKELKNGAAAIPPPATPKGAGNDDPKAKQPAAGSHRN